jgi:hypothetical protein
MKRKIYLSVTFFMAVLISRAQVKQGEILLGGNVGFSTEKDSPPDPNRGYQKSLTNIFIGPSYGKAIKDNLLAGFDLNYTAGINEQDYSAAGVPGQGYALHSHNYGAGVFIRKYKYLGSGFCLFMQGRLGGAYNTQKTIYTDSQNPDMDAKGYTVTLGFYPGISYAICKRVQLETGFQNLAYMQYSHQQDTYQPGFSNTPIRFNVNSFSLGSSFNSSLSGFIVGVRFLLGGS